MAIFKNSNEFSLHIEALKLKHEFETYTETLVWFYENETDHEMEEIAKMLNSKLIGDIRNEASAAGLLKDEPGVRLM